MPQPLSHRPSTAMIIVSAMWLTACGTVQESCSRMCAASLTAQEDCLRRDGSTWEDYEARGWADADAFTGACETWAFEGRRLQRDAWWRGDLDGHDMNETCETRERELREAPACETLESQGWAFAWEEPDDGT